MSNQQIDKLPLLTLWFVDQQIVYLTVPLDVRKGTGKLTVSI